MRRRLLPTSCLTALVVGMLAAFPANAQDAEGSVGQSEGVAARNPAELTAGLAVSQQVYFPADFLNFVPRNALDMLERVPGFTIQDEDSARGLGQASGNILVNGERLTSKSVSARDQLRRIPLDNVVRIEIVDGAALDIPGLSGRIANVIATSGSLSGQFSWRPQASTGPAKLRWGQGEVSVSGSRGKTDFTFALRNNPFYGGTAGPNFITDNQGRVQERFSTQYGVFDFPKISGNFAFNLPGSASANLSMIYGIGVFRARERETALDSNLPFIEEVFRTKNDRHEYEIGGDIQFAFGPGRLRLIALESFERQDFGTQSISTELGRRPLGTRFERLGDTGERIARAEYGWQLLGGDWQLSAEAAFNRLDNIGRLFLLGEDEEFFEIPFPSGTGGVREDRYETILSYGRPITGRLSIQLAGGMEFSQISQTGANALARTFQRPKGSVSLAWKAAAGLDVSLEVARRVGQLSFNDFLAQVNISDDTANAGNNELRPQQSWELELEISRNFGAWGSATLRLFDEHIEDFVTIVPVGLGQSSGNIDSARRYGYELKSTVRLDPAGFNGGRIDFTLQGEKSELDDPVGGFKRRFDRSNPRNVRIDFRHDVPATNWAWGLEFRDTQNAPYYRVTEVGVDYNVATFGAVYLEHKDVFGMTVQVRAANLLRGQSVRQRTVHSGPRSPDNILFTEDRRRDVGFVFNLDVSGSF